jgi:proline iminopeptidase
MRKRSFMLEILVVLLLFYFTPRAQTQNAVAIEDGIKKINDVGLYYKVMGSGEPIVIIHGGPGLDHSYFLPQMAKLAETHKLIFFDQRAHGRSTVPADTNAMMLGNFVKDIEGIRKAFNLKKVNLMGHSWGGLPALSYAIKYPDNLNSLMLINSVGASSDFRDAAAKNQMRRVTREDSLARACLMQSEDFRNRDPKALAEFFRITFRSTFYNRTLADSLTLVFNEGYVRNSAMLKYMNKDKSFLSYDLHQRLAGVNCPTLIIHGEADTLPIEAAQKIHQHIKNSELVVLKNCGHFPYIETPKEFFGTINEFLKKVGK